MSRYAHRIAIVGIALLAAAVVSFVTIDLGPALRARAEQAASSQLGRPVRIGGLSTYLLPGRFLIEDLTIDGLSPGDDPFFVCERIVISTSWLALLGGEILVDDVDMWNWRMVAESFPDGRQSFPRLVPESEPTVPTAPPVEATPTAEAEARRIVTTVQFLRAHEGEFVYRDHNAPWNVTARNIDLTLEKRVAYGGEVSFSQGTVAIGDFEPMTTSMQASYDLDGGEVTLTHIDLSMDGFRSTVVGTVDLLAWPESTYRIIDSDIDLPTMKSIFFADDPFTVDGQARLTGAWHIFEGGRELTASFESEVWTLNGVPFPESQASLLWTDDRFEVFDYASDLYRGDLALTFSMAPLGTDAPGMGRLDTTVTGADVAEVFSSLGVAGIRPEGRASGRSVLRWPLGRFAEHTGEGRLTVTPRDGVPLLTPGRRVTAGTPAYAAVPFDPEGEPWRVPLGGEVVYTVHPETIRIAPSRIVTPLTRIEFQGETAFGEASRLPFEVVSADWQESDRLMAGLITAFGRPTGEVRVGGRGRLDGVMTGAFSSPRIEARFAGEGVRAWNVNWGRGSGTISVEDGYLDVVDATFARGGAGLQVEGRFALGARRGDGGNEIDARFGLTAFPAQRLREIFSIDGYEINGPLDGAFELSGEYRRPFGSGTLAMTDPTAWGEPFDRATARLRFEGDGVRVDGLEMRKGGGRLTGAMLVRWNGTYSLNLDGRDIDMSTIASLRTPRARVGGMARFAATGAGAFADPRYAVQGTINDFSVNDAGVGQVTGEVAVRDGQMGVVVEAASTELAISGSGRVELTPERDADLSFRLTNTRIDPFVRTYTETVPDGTSATVSGTLTLDGPLMDLDRLAMAARVEQLQLSLFDYEVRNAEVIRLRLDRNVVRVDAMHLVGDQTKLTLYGEVGLDNQAMALRAEGDASLSLLQGVVADIRSSGTAHLVADIRGRLDRPAVVGAATIENGRIRHFSLPHGLESIDGRLVFEPDGVRFDELTGVLAGGPVQFGGRVGLRGYTVDELNVWAQGTAMNLRFPEGVRSVVDADLTLGGDVEEAILSGTVTVVDAVWVELFEPRAGLLDFSSQDRSLVPQTIESTVPLRYDLRVVAPSSLRVSDNTTRLVASAELTVGGTYDQPQLFGNAEIDRGEVFFEGNRYRVTRGSLGFADPTRINPFFDIEAETDIRVPAETYRVTLGISGTMDRLDLELSSDPPLQEPEIISLLLGDTRDPEAAELRSLRARETSRQELLQAGAARLLTSPLSSGVGRVVQDSFGVDTFEIVPSLADPTAQQSTQLLPTARVLIGRRISDRAHVTFSRAVSGANQDLIVVLEYDQTDRLSWILSQNADRTYALDFRVRHAF